MAEESEFDLSPFDSLISQSILDKLEKQIVLAKEAAIKANSNIVAGTGSNREEGFEEAEQDISLEATLEYKKLKNKLSKLKITELPGDALGVNSSTAKISFSEDVDFILNIIRKTKRSLKDSNNFKIFEEEVLKAKLHLTAENELKQEILESQERIEKLKEEMRKIEMDMSVEEEQKTGQICRLKDEHFLLKKEGKATLTFTDSYFEAQASNSKSTHKHKVDKETEKIGKIKNTIDRDVHCLAVMESWTEDFCEQLEEKINEWRRKLRGDELVMDMRIDAKRRAIKSQEELIKSLNETVCVLAVSRNFQTLFSEYV